MVRRRMKKALCVLLTAVVIGSLAGCGPYGYGDLERARYEGYEDGYKDGLHDVPVVEMPDFSDFAQESYDIGYDEGYNDGYDIGYDAGYENGYTRGYNDAAAE